jgi:hypothetical protein
MKLGRESIDLRAAVEVEATIAAALLSPCRIAKRERKDYGKIEAKGKRKSFPSVCPSPLALGLVFSPASH